MNLVLDPMINLEDPQLVLAYLRGEASPPAVEAIETRLGDDDAYAEWVQELDQAQLLKGDATLKMYTQSAQQLEGELKGLEAPSPLGTPLPQRPRSAPRFMWAAAAIILCLFGAAIWWSGQQEQQTPRELAAQYIQPYKPSLGTRGSSAGASMEQVIHLFHTGEDAKAIEHTLALLDDTLSTMERAELTLSIASYNLQQGHPDMARIRVLDLDMFPEPYQKAQALWTRTLADLSEDNPKAASRSLEQLIELGVAPYVERAKVLQAQLAL